MEIPRQPAPTPDMAIEKLFKQLAQMQDRLAAIEKCVQVDPAGTSVTIKAPMKISLDGMEIAVRADATLELDAGAQLVANGGALMSLDAGMIRLNS